MEGITVILIVFVFCVNLVCLLVLSVDSVSQFVSSHVWPVFHGLYGGVVLTCIFNSALTGWMLHSCFTWRNAVCFNSSACWYIRCALMSITFFKAFVMPSHHWLLVFYLYLCVYGVKKMRILLVCILIHIISTWVTPHASLGQLCCILYTLVLTHLQ